MRIAHFKMGESVFVWERRTEWPSVGIRWRKREGGGRERETERVAAADQQQQQLAGHAKTPPRYDPTKIIRECMKVTGKEEEGYKNKKLKGINMLEKLEKRCWFISFPLGTIKPCVQLECSHWNSVEHFSRSVMNLTFLKSAIRWLDIPLLGWSCWDIHCHLKQPE